MWLGEFVHVVRPLVYVVMLKRYGLTSWKPWLTMMALDATAGEAVLLLSTLVFDTFCTCAALSGARAHAGGRRVRA
jgi:hypothetical protein